MNGRILLLAAAAAGFTVPASAQTYDLVINGGRVIDPETGLDGVRSVGISGDEIAAISETPLKGARVVDATGLIVSPGFIDIHSHAVVDLPANRMQAYDGVTTALEMESGVLPIGAWYDAVAAEGRATALSREVLRDATRIPRRGLSCRGDRSVPRIEGRGPEAAKRRSRYQMALEIKGVVDGAVKGEEPLGRSR